MKQEDLVVGKEYLLKKTGSLCHFCSFNNGTINPTAFEESVGIFIGMIELSSGKRNVFFKDNTQSGYLMFSTERLDYIIEESEVLLKKFISEHNIDKKLLQKIIKEL